MPLVSKAFGDIITFTRASTATFTGSNGLIQSAAIDAPRFDYDPVTLAAKGLLIEEQRTNLVLRSEDFSTTWSAAPSGVTVTTDTFIAPDGTLTADTLIADGTVAGQAMQQSITFTGDGTKCISIFLKAGTAAASAFDVRDTTAGVTRMRSLISWAAGVPTLTSDIGTTVLNTATPMGNDWYRVLVAGSGIVAANNHLIRVYPAGASLTPVSGTIIAWGAQAENGAFPTSYIPTVASQVTRSADVASVNTLSPWYNATEGTIAVRFDYVGGGSDVNANNRFTLDVSDGTSSNRHIIYNASGSAQTGLTQVGGVSGGSVNAGTTIPINTVASVAYAVKLNDFAFSLNGSAASTNNVGAMPTGLSRLNIGSGLLASSAFLNGHIRRITYYPRRLSNAELQAITA